MEREMLDLKVSIDEDDYIIITQSGDNCDDMIKVHPDQLPILIKWLQAARDELLEYDED